MLVKRGILFAKTRAFTVALKTWIEETDDLRFLKPGYLVGSKSSSGERDILNDFIRDN